MKKAIVAGASGLIGSELLNLLLNEETIDKVIALVRSPLQLQHLKLEQIVINFDELEGHKSDITGFAFYCCLGTTRAKTPNLDYYRKIDYAYPIKLAELAAENGIEQFHIVTALGANSRSRIFYNKLKGEVEDAVKSLKIESIHIYKPSLLVGKRNEFRLGERLGEFVMKVINPLLKKEFKKYRSIKAVTVARAMVNQTMKDIKGIHEYPSDLIEQLA